MPLTPSQPMPSRNGNGFTQLELPMMPPMGQGKRKYGQGQGALHHKVIGYVNMWRERCYHDGIPETAPDLLEAKGKAPSYRQICRAIFRNDTHLASLGYSRPKTASYMALKRIEIQGRIAARERV